ncbi:MAG: leucine-rich repeat domain-containing protein [Lachnospiraceae bacterium]|nr:leucine-rich repeat domain-containing protein [Lachnospiraceae bacterium]
MRKITSLFMALLLFAALCTDYVQAEVGQIEWEKNGVEFPIQDRATTPDLFASRFKIYGQDYSGEGQSRIAEEGVESIAGWGQYHGLSNIMLPSSIKIIGDEAFHLCPRLSDFVIPDGVKEIGRNAFSDCDNLTNISIPASVEKKSGTG